MKCENYALENRREFIRYVTKIVHKWNYHLENFSPKWRRGYAAIPNSNFNSKWLRGSNSNFNPKGLRGYAANYNHSPDLNRNSNPNPNPWTTQLLVLT